MILEPPVFEAVPPTTLKPFYLTRQDQRKQEKKRGRDRKADARPFIGWDGEGVTREDGVHVYTLLANSLGSYIAAKDIWHPLTTEQCFRFILNTAAQHKGVNHVWFSFSYDVNMMLGDLPEDELRTLYERDGQWTYCPSVHCHILYRPKKTFSLRSEMRNISTGKKRKVYIKMDDTFTFFNTSFVKAVDTYLGAEWEGRDLVLLGKSERATGFNTVDTIAYNKAELTALVLTMNELRERLSFVDIHPRDWHGPGAVASKLLQMNDVKAHTAELPEEIDLPLRHSYAGGWFELFKYGCTQQSTWRYDKRSAYPYAATQLPTAQGRWTHEAGSTAEIQATSLYRCEWHCAYKDEKYPQPFHYRSDDGHICYPPHVQGWYWGTEVRAAQKLPYGVLAIKEAWHFVADNDSHPFAFLQGLYDERRRLINAKHPAQLALKLAINSVYGKLIQQLGWSINPDGSVKRPAYFNLFWASQITAATRAALLELMVANNGYDDVISFETDAIFTSRQWENVPLSEKLGDWEELELHDLTYLQSGVYATSTDVAHVRGMTKIVWPPNPVQTFRDMLQSRWSAYEYELTAFVGLGTGLTQNMDQWRKWITVKRKLQTMEPLNGLVKRNHDPLLCECGDDDDKQLDIWHRTRVYPAVYAEGLQRAYDIEWSGERREVFDPSELVGDWD